jgi:hypothetical protein
MSKRERKTIFLVRWEKSGKKEGMWDGMPL